MACVLRDNLCWIFLYVRFKFTKQPLVGDTNTCVMCETKYEDKYLDSFRKCKRAFRFDENETILYEQKILDKAKNIVIENISYENANLRLKSVRIIT